MTIVPFKISPEAGITPCPNCGNRTEFTGCSCQVDTDSCVIWVACRCGFDPTAELPDHRYEDVMGVLDQHRLLSALSCWDNALAVVAVKH